jgi:AcrR family transcriptional regulator
MRLRPVPAAAITLAMAKRMTARDDAPLGDTAGKLVAAAAKEFKRHGFHGTDSNKIARRAGFAPQTFYRWFRDKTQIFLAVYRAWEDEEREVVGGLLAARAPDERLVDAIVAHHRAYRLFRRSLRQLSLEDAVVRRARAESRLRQIERIRRGTGLEVGSTADIAVILLQIERLSDAIAEGELSDLGIADAAARAALGALLARLRR